MEGPGTRDAPRELAMLLPALPVDEEGSRIPRPRQMLSGRGGGTGCFNRLDPILAAAVQVADVQPQSLDHSRTSPLGCTHGLSRSSASDPAPLNSDQLPSCEMDARSIARGCGCRIERTIFGAVFDASRWNC